MDDLSGPRAKLSWATQQISALKDQFNLYFQSQPYEKYYTLNIDKPGRTLRIKLTKPIPPELAVWVGQIIAAQRDSLDLLVTALAGRNGAVESTEVCFPIVDSEDKFGDAQYQKRIRKLSANDQDLIASLKPYRGGNDLLYALHSLNNQSKHRRLIAIAGASTAFGFGGNGFVRKFEGFGMRAGLEHGAPIAYIEADAGINLNVTLDVAFQEIGVTPLKPVIETLHEFGTTTKEIVDLFA